MNEVFEAALALQADFEARGWRFCFIGGIAVQRWGEPRLTQDVDVTLLTGFGQEAPFVDELLERYLARVADAKTFALRSRVVLLRADNRVPMDIALGALPFEERAVARATPYDVGEGRSLLTCSAEDLVVLKTFAGRARDWADLEGILERSGERLDRRLIWSELTPLLELKQDSESASRLMAMLAKASPPTT